jgi:hypothetical protein
MIQIFLISPKWTRGSVVGWGTVTSRKVAGSNPGWVDFFSLPDPSNRTIVLGSTQTLTENARNHLGVKSGRRLGPNVWKSESINLSQP